MSDRPITEGFLERTVEGVNKDILDLAKVVHSLREDFQEVREGLAAWRQLCEDERCSSGQKGDRIARVETGLRELELTHAAQRGRDKVILWVVVTILPVVSGLVVAIASHVIEKNGGMP